MRPERGDVVRSSDPFKTGVRRQRPWLIVNNDSHPFRHEQFIAVSISTSEFANSLPLADDVWDVGGVPQDSYVSPWAIHSPRIEDIVVWQGRVSEQFIDTVIDRIEAYLR